MKFIKHVDHLSASSEDAYELLRDEESETAHLLGVKVFLAAIIGLEESWMLEEGEDEEEKQT